MTALNIASRESMKSAQIVDCALMTSFDQALTDVRAESEVCIVATITEMLLVSGDCGTIFSTIDPILTAFNQKLTAFCVSRPRLMVNNDSVKELLSR